jgi:hypothetical protein
LISDYKLWKFCNFFVWLNDNKITHLSVLYFHMMSAIQKYPAWKWVLFRTLCIQNTPTPLEHLFVEIARLKAKFLLQFYSFWKNSKSCLVPLKCMIFFPKETEIKHQCTCTSNRSQWPWCFLVDKKSTAEMILTFLGSFISRLREIYLRKTSI